MKVLLGLIAVLSFSAHAQNLIKTFDGKIATCQDKADVFSSDRQTIYRPIELKQDGNSANVKIEFLRCVNNNGSFKFVRDMNPEKREFSPFGAPEISLSISRSHFSMMAVNSKYDVIDHQELSRNKDGSYSVELSTLSAGEKSLEIFLKSHAELVNHSEGKTLDRYEESLGSYRLILK